MSNEVTDNPFLEALETLHKKYPLNSDIADALIEELTKERARLEAIVNEDTATLCDDLARIQAEKTNHSYANR